MTYKKYVSVLVFILASTLILSFPRLVQAKKVLPRFQSTTTGTTSKTSTGSSKTKPQVTVKFRNDRKAIIVTFSNLSVAQSISYNLVYSANGVDQGFGGNITELSGTQTREIVLGTCSHGVCRYDTGIKNAKFSVTYKLLNGKTYVKVFKLKV